MAPRTVTLTMEELSDLITRAVDEQVARRERSQERERQINRYWSYSWTALALGMSEQEVRDLVRQGKLVTRPVNDHGPFVTRRSIEAYLAGQGLRAQWDRFPDQPVGVPV
jgi:hypothetical protein